MLTEDIEQLLQENESLLKEIHDRYIFITGGSGFFGTWLRYLFALSNRELGTTIKVTSLVRKIPEQFDDAERFIPRDMKDFKFELGTYDFVIHAAQDQTSIYETNRSYAYNVNTQGTEQLYKWARRSCYKLMYVSSGAVYPITQASPDFRIEDARRIPPAIENDATSYAASKIVGEWIVSEDNMPWQLDTVIVRPFTFFGPGVVNTKYAIVQFVSGARGEIPFFVIQPLTQRSYMYPTDLVHWLLTILIRSNHGSHYNIGSSIPYQMSEVAKVIADVWESPPPLKTAAWQNHPITRYIPDTSKTAASMGLRVSVTLKEGLERWKKYLTSYGVGFTSKG